MHWSKKSEPVELYLTSGPFVDPKSPLVDYRGVRYNVEYANLKNLNIKAVNFE